MSHNTDLENAMNESLSEKWGSLRGIQVVSIALSTVTLPEEDQELIKHGSAHGYHARPDHGRGYSRRRTG